MMFDFRGGGGSKRIGFLKVKIGLRGRGGVKNYSKNWTLFMNDPLTQISIGFHEYLWKIKEKSHLQLNFVTLLPKGPFKKGVKKLTSQL